ncbi:hypothetical protein A2415_04120 [candidate division WWE3 bacterium RIFOXYC1_FULL_39_7]|uniref:Uncharacterized protein n=2 Tax=Katanobacteria TaxID=422282 RepID=A0A1F4X7N0_UNCKA|nr:MAG: hypothetical protein A2415_04120 [candidate division WWE3 bacterium RIFOXYC1_FULL_39_7]OGC77639.1 MAG: hypothetical protein A2619_05370 [candidate division WWE3 bacterium RIFOXYD1_FULL_39_9]
MNSITIQDAVVVYSPDLPQPDIIGGGNHKTLLRFGDVGSVTIEYGVVTELQLSRKGRILVHDELSDAVLASIEMSLVGVEIFMFNPDTTRYIEGTAMLKKISQPERPDTFGGPAQG